MLGSERVAWMAIVIVAGEVNESRPKEKIGIAGVGGHEAS
jgi:hypothetical protein